MILNMVKRRKFRSIINDAMIVKRIKERLNPSRATILKAKKMILNMVKRRRFRKIVKSGMILKKIRIEKAKKMILSMVKRRRFRKIVKNGMIMKRIKEHTNPSRATIKKAK